LNLKIVEAYAVQSVQYTHQKYSKNINGKLK